METTVPYHPGFLLGRSVDMKKVEPRFMLLGEEINPTQQKVNVAESKFSFITTLKDFCDILSLPPEYVLKVKAEYVKNEMVEACLNNLGKTDLFTIIFRCTFVEHQQYLYPDVIPVCCDFSEEQVEIGGTHHTTESLIAEAAADLELNVHAESTPVTGSLSKIKHSHHGTHWVKAIDIGNELVTVMTFSINEGIKEKRKKTLKKLKKLKNRLKKCLRNDHGQLDLTKIQALQKVTESIDNKLPKESYKDICLEIFYCSFTELDKYPASLAGMMKTIESFMDQCVGWAERSKHGVECEVEACVIKCIQGFHKDEKVSTKKDSMKQNISIIGNPSSSEQSVAYHPSKEEQNQLAETNVDDDIDSFVVLDQGSRYFYNLRVTLQSFKKDNYVSDRSSSLDRRQFPEATVFDNLFKLIIRCTEAELLVQNFLSGERYRLETSVDEANEVLRSIQHVHIDVYETVADLDFVCIPSATTLKRIIFEDPLSTVMVFIENVTSKLPPGSDIDLLMIGKTGHGKSSTGNSILGQNKFLASADEESVTNETGVGWTEIDGRKIKVVDTPGVCDTRLRDGTSSTNHAVKAISADHAIKAITEDHAIKAISEAIASCPEGFHALLLIISFGSRMTAEEEQSIKLLKSVLGENIIRSHCICVITHGDEFELKRKENNTTFKMWCKSRSEFLNNLFKECKYRCVLFNNRTKDFNVKKTQLIELVSIVDSLNNNGTRYTNQYFELAQRERKRIITEGNVPQVNEEIMKDMQLILDNLSIMVNNTSEVMHYRNELSRLKEKVDNLNNKVSENEQLGRLVAIVRALTATIQDSADITPDNSDVSENTQGQVLRNEGRTSPDNQVSKDMNMHAENLQAYYNNEVLPVDSSVTQEVGRCLQAEIEKDKRCFPGSSVITLSNGKSVTLEELHVGDKVLVRDNTGHLSFDTVYMFGHKEIETFNEFITLKTATHTVHVTAEHYVYCVKHDKEVCVAAKDVQVGDSLLVATREKDLMVQSVESVTFEKKRGLFAPFTNTGNIIIDGVLMSCYINVLSPTTCHNLLWPVRQLYHISPNTLSYLNGSPSQYPVPHWIKAVMKLI